MPAVAIKIDPREMQDALKKLSILSDKLPSELVNQKSYRVFQKAVWGMKVVSKETINEELGASAGTKLVLLKSGKFSKAKKNMSVFFGMGNVEVGGSAGAGGFSLLAAIVQSRAKKSGRKSPWADVPKEEGIKLFEEAAHKVYMARIRSRAFFKATFATIRNVFKGGGSAHEIADDHGAVDARSGKGRIADAIPAKENLDKAKSTFWLISPRHDLKDALDLYAAPVLQAAFDEEGEETFRHVAELEYKQAIKALGIRVT